MPITNFGYPRSLKRDSHSLNAAYCIVEPSVPPNAHALHAPPCVNDCFTLFTERGTERNLQTAGVVGATNCRRSQRNSTAEQQTPKEVVTLKHANASTLVAHHL